MNSTVYVSEYKWSLSCLTSTRYKDVIPVTSLSSQSLGNSTVRIAQLSLACCTCETVFVTVLTYNGCQETEQPAVRASQC